MKKGGDPHGSPVVWVDGGEFFQQMRILNLGLSGRSEGGGGARGSASGLRQGDFRESPLGTPKAFGAGVFGGRLFVDRGGVCENRE